LTILASVHGGISSGLAWRNFYVYTILERPEIHRFDEYTDSLKTMVWLGWTSAHPVVEYSREGYTDLRVLAPLVSMASFIFLFCSWYVLDMLYTTLWGRVIRQPDFVTEIREMAIKGGVDPELLAKLINEVSGTGRTNTTAATMKRVASTWIGSNRKTWPILFQTEQCAAATTLAMSYTGIEDYQRNVWSLSGIFDGMSQTNAFVLGKLHGGRRLATS
jgi:hypothetical protein